MQTQVSRSAGSHSPRPLWPLPSTHSNRRASSVSHKCSPSCISNGNPSKSPHHRKGENISSYFPVCRIDIYAHTHNTHHSYTHITHTTHTHTTHSPYLPVQSPDCFIFVSDFNPSRTPTGGGKKFYMTSSGDGTSPLSFPSRGKSPTPRRLLSGDDIK